MLKHKENLLGGVDLEMITYVATLKALPGKEAELAEFSVWLTKEVQKEEGCVMCIPHVAKDDPAEIVIFEQYKDEQALEAHNKSVHMQEAGKKIKNLVAAPPQIKFLIEL